MAEWFVTDNPVGGKHIIVATVNLGEPSRSVVAALPPHNPDSPANARLIAAAPDLLAACEAVREFPSCCEPDCRSVLVEGAIREQCEAAIAKATGQSDA